MGLDRRGEGGEEEEEKGAKPAFPSCGNNRLKKERKKEIIIKGWKR